MRVVEFVTRQDRNVVRELGYDPAEFLGGPGIIAEYLGEAVETGDPQLIGKAAKAAVRALRSLDKAIASLPEKRRTQIAIRTQELIAAHRRARD
jgi:DNA-binding phage protein